MDVSKSLVHSKELNTELAKKPTGPSVRESQGQNAKSDPKDKVHISREAGLRIQQADEEESQVTEAELTAQIDFKDPTEKDLGKFRELVSLRIKNGYYSQSGSSFPQAQSKEEKELEIAKRLAGQSLVKS